MGLGISPTGLMFPSVAAMAQPSGPVMKFNLTAKDQTGVIPFPEAEQDLIDPQVGFANGLTTLRYTVVANQGDFPVYSDGKLNTLIGACGSSEAWGFHQLYGSFTFSAEVDPTEAPVVSPTVAPVNGTGDSGESDDSAGFRAVGAFVPVIFGSLLALW
mmetsp:Transcript_29987/g.72010  ORF Transcript_29987/g.72010 Transcript_29987/m.72010 type:complete len:158 (+) Transcript_29987:52-525(+)